MKEWYNKYKNYIVIALLVLLGLKSCQSCSRNRTIEFNNIKHTELVDSLKNELVLADKEIDSLRYDIKIYKGINDLYVDEISRLNNTIDQYKEDNRHYRNTNRVLVNTNNQIINKEKE